MTYRRRAKTRDIRPTARILFLMTLRRSADSSEILPLGDTSGSSISSSELSSSSSSFVQQLSMASNISVTMRVVSNRLNNDKHQTHSFHRRTADSMRRRP